jgi:diguanylate cyclase
MDHFKAFNDTCGHLAGDRLLREFAELLDRSVRPQDRVYRYGGEEFSLILPDTDLAGATALGERLRELVARQFAAHRVTASFGVALAELDPPADDDATAEPARTLVAAADAALYAAKRAGRNRVVAWQGHHPAADGAVIRQPASG